MQTPRVLALCGDESACCLYRVWQPFAELERHGFVAEWASIHGCPQCGMDSRPVEMRSTEEPWKCPYCGAVSRPSDSMNVLLPRVAIGQYTSVLTPRVVWPVAGDGQKWIDLIHRLGMAWWYEADDDCWSPSIVDRQMKLFESERLKGYDQLEWERLERVRFLAECDGVTVSTQRLATIVRRYAPEGLPVTVIPNAIDAKWFRNTLRGCGRIPELEGKLTIGWAGGTREFADFSEMSKAWTVIAERYPDVMFVVQGHLNGQLVDSVPKHRRATLPWVHLSEYPRALLNIDIGCCSVAPRVFNTAKTPIKWFELSLAGASCVVSKTLYGNAVTDGVDGFVAETAEEWVSALSRLIESAELRRTIQREARRTVMTEHSLENLWSNWIVSWSGMLEQFHEKRSRQLVLSA